ncbi:MAG: threonylcarbamoyl-AMP synthase [Clostridia bacterium]|nr:threonylcarbamoyl-AMP synthase [Clostridia bacterium]
MDTIYIKAEDIKGIQKGGEILQKGGLVAFPTETVYGLGANGLDETAVKEIYVAKGRPSDNPLILHITSMEDAEKIAYLNDNAIKMAGVFWPGPLTMVLPKKDIVPKVVTGGLSTVAIRMPSNDTARNLISCAGVPVAAPSANTSGKPSPTDADAVKQDLDGKIHMIIDGGQCHIGIESTVLDLSGEVPMILRPGEITLDMIKKVLPTCEMEPGLCDSEKTSKVPKCPGMKYKHYSPDAQVIVFEESGKGKITEYIEKYKDKKVAVYCKNGETYPAENVFYWGENAHHMARKLFSDLRNFDKSGFEIVLCVCPEMSQMGQSVRNRLYKSAGYNIVK